VRLAEGTRIIADNPEKGYFDEISYHNVCFNTGFDVFPSLHQFVSNALCIMYKTVMKQPLKAQGNSD